MNNLDQWDERIALAVCEATGMTPERWDCLDHPSRVPWMEKTISVLESTSPPADDLQVFSVSDTGGSDVSRDELPWVGDEWDDLAPQIRRLLRHMHGREHECIENLVEYVWEAPLERIKDGAIHTAISRANKFLAKHSHCRLLSKVRGEPIIRWS